MMPNLETPQLLTLQPGFLPVVLIAMILALLIPLYQAWRDENIWQIMLAFSSASTKASIIVLTVSILRDDWMLGVVSVIVLSVGNAGFMLLANILKRMGDA
jgi:multicomponent Na+:H+ antiporter subunit F